MLEFCSIKHLLGQGDWCHTCSSYKIHCTGKQINKMDCKHGSIQTNQPRDKIIEWGHIMKIKKGLNEGLYLLFILMNK